MSMYKQLQTDPSLEKKGVEIDYGSFRVTLARAGGANKKYESVLEARTLPHRRAMKTDNMDNTVAMQVMREVYADTIVIHWETKDDQGAWHVGIEAPPELDADGNPIFIEYPAILPFNRDNVLAALTAIPELLTWFVEDANKLSLYRMHYLEEDSKN